MSTQLARVEQKRELGIAYVLWIAGVFGFAGIHRFYMGRWLSGILWLCTGGLCFVGQLIDLIFMSRMLEDSDKGAGW